MTPPKAILGITAQFINNTGKLQSLVLAMKEVVGEDTGENIHKYVLEGLKEYEIIKTLGYFVMDNAPDNGSMITASSQRFTTRIRS